MDVIPSAIKSTASVAEAMAKTRFHTERRRAGEEDGLVIKAEGTQVLFIEADG